MEFFPRWKADERNPLSKLSDEELDAYVAKLDERAERGRYASLELEWRHRDAVCKLLALGFSAQMMAAFGTKSQSTVETWARWAYKEATGEEWPPNRGPESEGD